MYLLKVPVLEILPMRRRFWKLQKYWLGKYMISVAVSVWWTAIIFWISWRMKITIDRQLKHCNLAVLTKVDLVDREKIELIKEKVQEINPVCPITESENGNIKRSFYDMDLMKYQWAECEETTNSAETKPKTFP